MSDETEIEAASETESGGGTAVAVAERPGELELVVAVPTETEKRAELRKDRILLPFLLPVGAILAVALFAINLSRVFLAASQDNSAPAVIAAIVVTLSILIGATTIAAIPTLRTSSLVLAVCGIAALVLLAGSLVLGSAENKEVKSAEPTGPAINTLTVSASDFQFQAKNFDVPAGINEIKYDATEGSHTLAFDEPQFSYILLSAPGGGKNITKATFVEGEKYTIYCTISGHRALGMQATITVGKPGTKAEAGTATPSTTLVGPPTNSTTPKGQSEVDPSAQSSDQLGN